MGTGHQFLQLGRIFRAAALWLRENELSGVRPEDSEHFFIIFIRHCAEDNPYTLWVCFLQEISQGVRCRNVMRSIQKKLSDSFKAAGPRCGVDTPNDIL